MADFTLRHTYRDGCPRVVGTVTSGDQVQDFVVDLTGCVGGDCTASVVADPADPTGMTALLNWDCTGGGSGGIEASVVADPADPTGMTAALNWATITPTPTGGMS